MLTDRERRWVLEETFPHGHLVHTKQIHGGVAAYTHSVTIRDPSGNLVRLILKSQKHPEDWPLAFKGEARAIEAACKNGIPSPHLVAFSTELPAVLMTKLPGKVHLAPEPSKWIEVIAKTLKVIHDVPVPMVKEIRRYKRSTRVLDESRIPTWTRHRQPWERLIRLANEPLLQSPVRFTHGDYHPGNIIWDGQRLSGVIDWQGATIGPPQRDLAHCRANLGLLEGPDAADDFYAIYLAAGSREWPAQRIYDARDILGFAPHPEKVWDWQGFGRPDLKRSVLRRNLQNYVESITS
jgi:aminoglycoside phosphotransferase